MSQADRDVRFEALRLRRFAVRRLAGGATTALATVTPSGRPTSRPERIIKLNGALSGAPS